MAELSIGAVGPDVARLHTQLTRSGFDIPVSEAASAVFGPGTRDAVLRLQQQRGLSLTGEADGKTAEALKSGLLDARTTARLLEDAERRLTDPVIRAPGGVIVIPGMPGVPALPGHTPPTVPATPMADFRVDGVVMLEHGLPAAGLSVRLYQRGFGGTETRLGGDAKTDENGRYRLAYQVPVGIDANIELRAVVDQREIPLSKTRFGAGAAESLNVVAPSALQPLASEYTRLTTDLATQLGNDLTKLAAARENDERRDVTLLNRATGWDARLIALGATALATSPAVGLSPDILYALYRTGLPSDVQQLSRVNADTVTNALTRARDTGIVSVTDQQIDQAKRSFERFARDTRLATPTPGSRSTYGDILTASGLAADKRDAFATVYMKHRGSADDLWTSAREAGLTPTDIQTLQVQGKFAYLTANSDKVMTRLRTGLKITDPAALVERDLDGADAWKTEIRAAAGAPTDAALDAVIPPTYDGATAAARLNAYAEDMARKVRLAYPTQIVGRMIERDRADSFGLGGARDATIALVKNAASQGFRFGATPVGTFLKQYPGVKAGLSEPAFQSAARQMKTLHRTYQISPTNDEMAVLLQLGLTSAYDVVALSEPLFLDLYGPKFKSIAQARLVYERARQVTSVTYNLFTIARKLDTDVQVFGMAAPSAVRDSVRNELIKQFPTLESLFGSMDYCECEHCRSVLSPAAYLVDLLQFIDPESTVWDQFLGRWKDTHQQVPYTAKYKKPYDAFTARRADLPHIPLTCDNTNTALPYIDLVNEILEYYVAHDGQVEPAAANDTGTATTPELLAEPQHVITAAYDRLRDASYPLTLPFDVWLETVRAFCDYFETPLADVLDAFRASDALFAPAEAHDRAAIFMESLRLSAADVRIFADPNPLPAWFTLYGYGALGEATTVATDADTKQRIDLNSAKALSRRLGVTYTQLIDLLKTGFVNPALVKLTILDKVGISISAARLSGDAQQRALFNQNKDLLDKERESLSPADRTRFDALTTDDWQTLKELQAIDLRVAAFVDESGLTLAQVGAALQAIPFDQVLVLADPDAGCDFDLTTLRYASGRPADDLAFLRINLFVRVWRRLGWTIDETDRALAAFVPANAPFERATLNRQPLYTALMYIAHLHALDAAVRLGKDSRRKLLTLWSDIATTGEKSLYAQLFLTRSVLKADDVFDDPLGQYLSPGSVAAKATARWHEVQREGVRAADALDPAAFAGVPEVTVRYDDLQQVQHLSYRGVLADADRPALAARSASPVLPQLLEAVQAKGRSFSLINGHMLALQGALALTADDIRRILEDAGSSIDTAVLTLANVSLLFRYGLLAKALKLSPRELIALKQLAGVDPFMKIRPDPPRTIDEDNPFSQTLRFAEIAGEVKTSGLKVDDLEFLLRHKFDETGKYRQNPAATRALLTTLAAAIRGIRAANRVPDDPGAMTDEMLRAALGPVLPPDVLERFLAMMAGTAEFTATRTGVAPADELKTAAFEGELAIREVRYNATRQEAKLTFRGVLFDGEKAALLARLPRPVPPNPHVPSAVLAALLDDVQGQARAFFEKYLKKQPSNVQPASGFLDDADYDLLFAAPPAGLTESQLQAHVRSQRQRLNEAFLPYLQQRLIRQLAIGTVTAQSTSDPVLVESLLTDERLVADVPAPGQKTSLLESVVAIGDPGVTVTFFAAPDATGAPLATTVFPAIDTGLKGTQGNPLRPSAARSARFEAYIEVPASGAYRFYVGLDRQGASVDLRFDHLAVPRLVSGAAGTNNAVLGTGPAEFIELKAGIAYRMTLELRNLGGGEGRLLVQGETLPKDTVAQLVLYPDAAVARAEQSLQRLAKALQLVDALGLSEREVRYFATHAPAFDGLDLTALPTRAADDTLARAQALFRATLRLVTYARLKRDLASDSDDIVGVFEANAAGDIERTYAAIAALTKRDISSVRATARALAVAPSFDNEQPLDRLWQALQIVERFGVPVGSLVEWTRIVGASSTGETRFAIARDLKEALKARFDTEGWQRVAQPIFDALRRRQRDALVAYVMQRGHFDRVEQLYEYFLIDPAMEPVVQTSRIRLAISSVQLFIQRCLLNLEKDVHPSAIINAEHWEWMKRYRVWEANRKIFLFPENWLEPEFRDDKTHLYTELEGLLLQGDVSRDLVEDAFLGYLRKLEQIARLEIVAMHLEEKDDPAQNTLHVIGRTHSEPHQYFYRQYLHQMWTRWEPIPGKIEGAHLAPVVWRDRFYLFWVTFIEQARATMALEGPKENNNEKLVSDTKLSELGSALSATTATSTVEAHLHWTERINGDWNTQETVGADSTIRRQVDRPFNPNDVFIHVSKEYENGEERGVFVHMSGKIERAFYVAGRNSPPAVDVAGAVPPLPFVYNSRRAAQVKAHEYLAVAFKPRVSTDPEKATAQAETAHILDHLGGYTLVPCNAGLSLGAADPATVGGDNPQKIANLINSSLSEIAALMQPVFLQDKKHTLFIEPYVTERTIEGWEEWVTRTPTPDPGWDDPGWIDGIFIDPEIPWKKKINPGDPVPEFDRESLLKPRVRNDWLINPNTALVFDGGLIHTAGRAAELKSAPFGAGFGDELGTALVHPASDVATDTIVVSTGASTGDLPDAFLDPASIVTIVGGGGLNSGIKDLLNAERQLLQRTRPTS